MFCTVITILLSATLVMCSTNLGGWKIAPVGWLNTGSKSIVLELQHEGVEPGFMEDAAGVTRQYLSILTNAGYTVYLDPSSIASDIRYWQEYPVKGSHRIDQELPLVFQRALATGTIDWAHVSRITPDHDDRFSSELACKASRWPIMER